MLAGVCEEGRGAQMYISLYSRCEQLFYSEVLTHSLSTALFMWSSATAGRDPLLNTCHNGKWLASSCEISSKRHFGSFLLRCSLSFLSDLPSACVFVRSNALHLKWAIIVSNGPPRFAWHINTICQDVRESGTNKRTMCFHSELDGVRVFRQCPGAYTYAICVKHISRKLPYYWWPWTKTLNRPFVSAGDASEGNQHLKYTKNSQTMVQYLVSPRTNTYRHTEHILRDLAA